MITRRDFLKYTAGVAVSSDLVIGRIPDAHTLHVAILRHRSFATSSEVYSLLDQYLKREGFNVTFISPSDLADMGISSRNSFDCLILTDSPHCPRVGFQTINNMLQRGKHLVLLGGLAFSETTITAGDLQLTDNELEKLLSSTPVDHLFFDFSSGNLSEWSHSTNKPEHGSRLMIAHAPFGKCIELDIKNLGEWQWDTFVASFPTSFPSEDNLFCFQAKGGRLTPQLAVEIDEMDGSRWVSTVDITTKWRRYSLQESGFHFLADASPKNRGGKNDHLNLHNASRVSFGLAAGLSQYHHGDNVIWVGEIGSAKTNLPFEGNTISKKPELPIFGDYEPYDLGNAISADAYSKQDILSKNIIIKSHFTGVSAVGFGLENKSSFTPLLEAKDVYGRYRGWALGMLVNYGGDYKGSCCVFSGVTSQNFYKDLTFIKSLTHSLMAIRDNGLISKTLQSSTSELSKIPKLISPAPTSFLHLSTDRRHFIQPNGSYLFMTGCNYLGCENRFCQLTPSSLEEDFRRAHLAGVNAFRIWVGSGDTHSRYRDAIRECARKYGIYLIHQIGAVGEDGDSVVSKAAETASYWRDEPMVLGYDLQNEPYLGTIAPIRFGGKLSPLLELKPYEKYASKIDQNWVETQVKQRPTWPQILGNPDENELRNLYAAYWIFDRWISGFMDSNDDYSTFPKLNGQISLTGEWVDFAVALNETFAQWINTVGGAVRKADPNHYITVGYNTCLSCLPCNKDLDFVSQHVYEKPTNLANVLKNVTTMDRLSTAWKTQPIALGEFGYTNGIQVGNGFLDIYTSAVGEMIHYLHSYSQGYGGCLKWMLIDLPAPIVKDNIPWITPDNFYEERFGMYWDDGTRQGRPKPIARALHFLRRYAEMGGGKGKLEIVAARNSIGTGYRFHSEEAIFVGDKQYDSPFLTFRTHSDHPGNIMLFREGDAILFLSTADARVIVDPSKWSGSPKTLKGEIFGVIGKREKAGDRLTLDVLEGEILKIA